MSEGNGIMSCRNICWIAGALVGFVAFLLIFQSSILWALVVGIVLAIALAFVLQRLFCSGVDVAPGAHAGMGASSAAGAALAAVGADRTRAQSDVPGAGEGDRFSEDAALDHAEAVAAAAGDLGEGTATMESAAFAASKASSATATPHPAPEEPAKKPAKKPASAGTKGGAAKAPASKKTASEGPELLAKPRGGKGDDLKQIKGVGPKFEKLLNDTGVWHFDQIASWSKKDIAIVDAKLKGFHGRIERDDWVKQAKLLAKGGETEFSKKVKKGDVY